MKKFLLLLSLLLIFSSTFAQDWKVKGFEPQIRLSFDEGMDYQKNFSFGADVIMAYRVNPIFRLGIGAGIDYVNLRFEEPVYINYKKYDAYYEAAMTFPVFANIKIDFLKTRISPYMAIDCGYNFFIPFSKYAEDNKLGLLIRPAFGADFHFSKCNLFVELSYKYQARTFDNTIASYRSYHQICQSIGVSF